MYRTERARARIRENSLVEFAVAVAGVVVALYLASLTAGIWYAVLEAITRALVR